MTKNRALKQAVRARQARTGEKYTQALREIQGSGSRPRYLGLEGHLEPGTLTAIVSGGGMTNLGLAMPALVRLVEAGHHLLVAPHDGRPEPWGLASPFDFATARGMIAPMALAELWASGDEGAKESFVELIERAVEGITFPGGAAPEETWVTSAEITAGKPAVIYVPDMQVDRPLLDWGPPAVGGTGDFDSMPAQIAGLKSVARRANAIVIGGHCMPTEYESGWRIVADLADETVVIDTEIRDPGEELHPVTLRHFVGAAGLEAGPARVIEGVVDTGFSDWRIAIMRASG